MCVASNVLLTKIVLNPAAAAAAAAPVKEKSFDPDLSFLDLSEECDGISSQEVFWCVLAVGVVDKECA